MDDLSPPGLNELIAAQTAALNAARAMSGSSSRVVAVHEEILRRLTIEAQKTGPFGRALALADVSRAPDAAGKLEALVLSGLRPLHVEALRPQQEFNRALVEVLKSVVGAPPSNREWVRRRLETLADPTAWRVKSHRSDVSGQVVELGKRTVLTALGPALERILARQRAWNLQVIATLEQGVNGDRLGELARLSDPGEAPFVWQQLLHHQRDFNQHVVGMLSQAADGADAAAAESAISSERASYVRRVQGVAQTLDFDSAALAKAPRRALTHAPRSLTWFLPFFNHPFGGVHTILRFADSWRRAHRVENRFVVYDNPHVTAREMESKVAMIFPEQPGTFDILKGPAAIDQLPPCDVGIITLWSGAYSLLRHPRAAHRAYFIQDYEPLFYPAGTVSALATNTYDLGFFGLFNTRGLYDAITAIHPMSGAWFEPAVDQELFHPRGRVRPEAVRVFFYGRPSVDRNAFELGIEALRLLKAKLGKSVEIFSAGEAWDPRAFDAHEVLENRGVLPYRETANLYRSADLGLVFMFTRHPSYLPLEMMACGVTVVTNHNSANDWLLKHGDNCLLAHPTASCVAEQLIEGVENAGLRERISRTSSRAMAATRWDEQTEKMWDALCAHVMR